MENNFKSNENKSLIWNLIYEQGGFNDIPDSMREEREVRPEARLSFRHARLGAVRRAREIHSRGGSEHRPARG